jgi:hypothetical protein
LGTGAVNTNGGNVKMDNVKMGEWHNEWNNLVEILYNRRYYEFENFFWKN